MSKIVSQERGIALGMVLIVIVLIGVMVAGTFFMSEQEYRTQASAQVEQEALSAAEFGLGRVAQTWNVDTATAMAVGAVRTRTDTVTTGITVISRTTRLGNNLFSLVSEGRVGSGIGATGRRRIGQVLIVPTAVANVPGALTTRNSGPSQLRLSGSATASGGDSTPAGWSCPPGGAPVAGYAMNDTTKINSSSNLPPTGNPPELQTPIANDSSTYLNIGGFSFDSLTHLATKIYAPGANASTIQPALLSGACDATNARNWGEPWRAPKAGAVAACTNYMPIIWGKGDLQFSSGRGQGILLVSGDFTASGGTEFAGLIVVRGSITTTGGGIKATGAVLAYNQNNTKNEMSGSTQIRYSSCAINAVLQQLGGNFPVRPIMYHAWTELP